MEKDLMNEEILKSYLEVIPNLKLIIGEDVMTSVTDKNNFIGYYPGEQMKMDLKVGTAIPNEDPLRATINQNKGISAIVPKEVYGFPFKAVTYPIRNKEGEVIGAVGFAKSLEREANLDMITSNLLLSIEQTNLTVQNITNESQELAANINSVAQNTDSLFNNLKEIDEIINLIKSISSKSNLLGLNAAIEAARVGEQGKGFAVVAEEMRKLAMTSDHSAEKVSTSLGKMKEQIQHIFEKVTSTNEIAANQAAATEEITATLEEITANTQKLSDSTKLQ